MKLKFWGTRGSIPVPGKDTMIYGGNTTCLEMTLESGAKIIVDAGSGIRRLGDRLLQQNEEVSVHLLMTHIHWDHLLGFPFFAPLYTPSTRLLVDGFPSCTKGLKAMFDNGGGEGFFPVKFDDVKAEINYTEELKSGAVEIDGVVIDTIPLQHPQGGFGFRFKEEEKRLVFITDNELTSESWADRKMESFIGFCEGADILIHDAQYTPEEKQSFERWGHSDYAAALDLAVKSSVGRLILFHHNPSRKDSEMVAFKISCENLAKEWNSEIEISLAREDSELTL